MEINDDRDFRSDRIKFSEYLGELGYEKENPTPKDLIDENIWLSINGYSDDVSLRTSDNHGNELKIMYEIFEHLYNIYSENDLDAFWLFSMDINLEFQGSLFNLLNGYYRIAASCLRNALELSLYGLYFQILDTYDNASKWNFGDLDSFEHIKGLGNVCNQLNKPEQFDQLNFILNRKLGYSLFNQKCGASKPGISRQLHSRLSEYVHSRPGYTLSEQWSIEIGPIYKEESFKEISNLYLETFILVDIFYKFAWESTIVDKKLYAEIISSELSLTNEFKTLLLIIWPELGNLVH